MTGKKDTPPSRDTGVECTFRSDGMSNSRRLYETIRMFGIRNMARTTAHVNPPARKRRLKSVIRMSGSVGIRI